MVIYIYIYYGNLYLTGNIHKEHIVQEIGQEIQESQDQNMK